MKNKIISKKFQEKIKREVQYLEKLSNNIRITLKRNDREQY